MELNFKTIGSAATLIVLLGGAAGFLNDWGIMPVVRSQLLAVRGDVVKVEAKVDKVIELTEVLEKSIETLGRINKDLNDKEKRIQTLEQDKKDRDSRAKDRRIKELEDKLRRRDRVPR